MRYGSVFAKSGWCAAGFVASLVVAPAPVLDRSETLNAPLEYEAVLGDVEAFQVTPSGDWVVYRAPQTGPTPELYAMPGDRSAGPVRITPAGVAVGEFQIAGTSVVYRAGADLFEVGQDFVPVQLNAPLNSNQVLKRFEIHGQRVFYLVEYGGNDLVNQLFSVPLRGGSLPLRAAPSSGKALPTSIFSPVQHGSAVPLSPAPSSGKALQTFVVAPDDSRVVLIGDLAVNDRYELFRVRANGSKPFALLSGPMVEGGDVVTPIDEPTTNVQVAAGSTRVVYVADQLTDGTDELFSVPANGSTLPVRINAPLVTGGDVESFRITPDGTRVVYRADQTVDDVFELFVVPIDGSAPPAPIDESSAGFAFFLSPAGDRVVYRQGNCSPTTGLLFSALLDGSSEPVPLSGLGCARDVAITPDSSRVLYLANPMGGSQDDLFSVPIDGSVPALELSLEPDVIDYELSADGARAVYRVATAGDEIELFTVPVDGSQVAVALAPSASPGAQVPPDFALAADSVWYRGDLDVRDVIELYRAPLDAGAAPERLNDPLPTIMQTTAVGGFALSPDGAWAVYATSAEVVSVPLAAPQDVRRLYASGDVGPVGVEMLVSQDSSRVFFRAHRADWSSDLYSAPIDGSAPAVRISRGTRSSDLSVYSYEVSPDGAWAFYSVVTDDGFGGSYQVPADGSAEPVFFDGYAVTYFAGSSQMVYRETDYNPWIFSPTRLLVRPTDGSAPPLELAPLPLGTQATVARHRLCADETRVVYTCDQETSQAYELFSSPVDGSVSPVKLSGALGVDRDVAWEFLLTPDGTRAVYVADRDANESYQLFVVPVDGSAAPLELSGAMVAGGSVALGTFGASLDQLPAVQVSADSNWAVFVADREVNERFELYSVPLDGSQPPVKLNGPLPTDADVSRSAEDVRISADHARVVYRADEEAFRSTGLWSAPIDGSAPAVPLTGPLGSEHDVQSGFAIVESDASVLFRADLVQHQLSELWSAPLDGSRLPTRRWAPAHPGARLFWDDFEVVPGERHVVYLADENGSGVFELLRFPIRRVPYHVSR